MAQRVIFMSKKALGPWVKTFWGALEGPPMLMIRIGWSSCAGVHRHSKIGHFPEHSRSLHKEYLCDTSDLRQFSIRRQLWVQVRVRMFFKIRRVL